MRSFVAAAMPLKIAFELVEDQNSVWPAARSDIAFVKSVYGLAAGA